MAGVQSNLNHASGQIPYQRESEILDSIDDTKIVRRLAQYRLNGGPRTYSLRAFWRAYMLMFLLNLASVCTLHRRLDNEPALMLLCGFSKLPHRTTFDRFIKRLGQHKDLVDEAQAQVTDQLKVLTPGLGERTAVDSTTVRTHAHPFRKSKITGQISDPEASWTAKASKKNPKVLEWYYGYKHHLLVDAEHQIPITGFTTTASRNDSPTLPEIMDKAISQFPWLKPEYVMADKGYDSAKNHEYVLDRDAVFICPTRDYKDGKIPANAEFSKDGVPLCNQGEVMEYLGSLPDKGHAYRCEAMRADPNGHHCDFVRWVDWRTEPNKRLHGPVRRESPEWRELYAERQSVERVFKSIKEFRRLERHYIRGLKKVSLHAAMSVLAYTATVLAQTRAGIADTNWMVQRVA